MGRTPSRWREMMPLLALVLVLGPIADSAAGDRAKEIHGSSDAFAATGVAVAWAILRDASEANTLVVMRIASDSTAYPGCAVDGVDPFSGRSQPVLARTANSGMLDVRTPRGRFADFPRTEVKFFASAEPSAPDPPALTVFYLGVPDAAPEFTAEAALRAYLDGRIARLRANPGGRSP